MAGKVFISHASADKPVVDWFVQLLEGGVGLRHSQIFCSSLEGRKIPPGKDFKAYIRDELAEADLVLALISRNYYASAFCMCELGAIWIQAKGLVPLVVPPLNVNDLGAVLSGIQSLKIDDESDLDSMRDLLSTMTTDPVPTPQWNKRRKDFLARFPQIMEDLPEPQILSAKEAATLTRERDEYRKEYEKADEQIVTLKKTVSELSQLKDQQKVATIVSRNLTEGEAFGELARAAATALRSLPGVVQEALFYDCRDESFWPEPEKWEGAPKDAEERSFLIYHEDGNSYSVRGDNPKIRNVRIKLNKLRNFVSRASSSFCQAYEDQFEEVLDFTSRDFWERNLFRSRR